MSVATGQSPATPPEGRYQRSGDARSDRGLKSVGAVLGTVLLAVIGWSGYHYVSGESTLSAQVITFDTGAADRVSLELDVTKATDAAGTCTVRALDESHGEVGRKDVRFERGQTAGGVTVELRTTGKATSAELTGCTPDRS